MLQLGFGPVPECSRDFNIRSIHLGGGDSNNTNAPLNNIYLSELRRDFLASIGITYAVFRIAKSRLRGFGEFC